MKPDQGKQILRFLKVLIGLGVAMIVVNISLTSWSLVKFRNERIRSMKEQGKISAMITHLREKTSQVRLDLQNVLLDNSLDRSLEKQSENLKNFETFVHEQLRDIHASEVLGELHKIDQLTEELLVVAERARVWRVQYNFIQKDLCHEVSMGIIRKHILKMKGEIDIESGKLLLKEIILYKKNRNEKNREIFEKYKKSIDEIRGYGFVTEELKRDVLELLRIVEQLNGEDNFDHLADIRENYLTPAFDHIAFTLSSLDTMERGDAVSLNPQFLNLVKTLILGSEATGVDMPADLDAYPLGFYNLRKNFLQLQRERPLLHREINSIFSKFDEALLSMESIPALQNQNLSKSMEEGLVKNRTQILVVGVLCTVLFLWLGWYIARHIKKQVAEIESARHESEESHKATQKLLEEKDKATKELESAHKELQANEQRYRQLSASAPIGIFEVTTDGTCLYTNPQWQKITGLSLGRSFGSGWMDVIHPADREKFSKWKSVVNEVTDFQLEFRILNAAKETLWVNTYITAICSITGNVIGYVGTIEDITERKRASAELDKANKQLVDISRQAGMAEIATDVLHNIGNVLNSVNVSLTLVADRLRKSKLPNLTKLNSLIQEHLADLGTFLSSDPKGKQVPGYLAQLTGHLTSEQETTLEEVKQLEKNIDHIKDIVTMQQNYAKVSGVTEIVKPVEVFEDALHMHLSSLTRHDIEIVKKYDEVAAITTDKHKVLQILVNLIANAKHACDECKNKQKKIILRITTREEFLVMSVEDNGIGIKPEYLARIFAHGFTTRKHGHGFGLHSGALSAKEMGGSLTVKSDGENLGATFTLELPLKISTPNPMPL